MTTRGDTALQGQPQADPVAVPVEPAYRHDHPLHAPAVVRPRREGPAVSHRAEIGPPQRRRPGYRPRRRIERGVAIDRRTGLVLAGFLVLATKAMLSAGIYIPWISPLLGMAVVVGIPTFMLYMADVVRLPSRSERLAVSVVLALGLLMASGLLINTLLPHKQVPRPLSGETMMLIVEGSLPRSASGHGGGIRPPTG